MPEPSVPDWLEQIEEALFVVWEEGTNIFHVASEPYFTESQFRDRTGEKRQLVVKCSDGIRSLSSQRAKLAIKEAAESRPDFKISGLWLALEYIVDPNDQFNNTFVLRYVGETRPDKKDLKPLA